MRAAGRSARMARAICSSSVVLPALGGATIRPARAFADGRQQIHRAHGDVAARAEVEALGRVHRDELGERGAGAVSRRRQAADLGDAGQLAARPALRHRPGHRGPLDQGEFLQEAGRHADFAGGRLHRVDQHRAPRPRFRIPVVIFSHRWCQRRSRAPPHSVCRKLCRKDVANFVASYVASLKSPGGSDPPPAPSRCASGSL